MARKFLLLLLFVQSLSAGEIALNQFPNDLTANQGSGGVFGSKPAVVFNFNEGSGSVVYDSAGNINGTLVGGIFTNGSIPGLGTGLRLTGTNGDGVLVSDPMSNYPANFPKTFIIVYKAYQITAGNQFLISQNNATNANTFSVAHRTIDNGTIDVQAGMNPGAGTTLTITASKLLRANMPTVITITASTICVNGCAENGQGLAQGVNVFVNGVIAGSSITTSWNGCSGNLGIGRNPAATSAVATGDVGMAAVLIGIPTKAQIYKIAQDILQNDHSVEQ